MILPSLVSIRLGKGVCAAAAVLPSLAAAGDDGEVASGPEEEVSGESGTADAGTSGAAAVSSTAGTLLALAGTPPLPPVLLAVVDADLGVFGVLGVLMVGFVTLAGVLGAAAFLRLVLFAPAEALFS